MMLINVFSLPYILQNRFNFFLFPPSDDDGVKNRDITLSPSIIASMKSRDCDFNKWLKEGASFVTIDEAESKVNSFREKYARKEQLEKEKQSKKWNRKNTLMVRVVYESMSTSSSESISLCTRPN